MKPVRFQPPLGSGPDAVGPPGPSRPSRAATRSTRSRARRCTRWRWARCTPAIIEPGHFRFQCHGEDVFHLEIVLGYQHRGVECAPRRRAGTPSRFAGRVDRRRHGRRPRAGPRPRGGGARRGRGAAAGGGAAGGGPRAGAARQPRGRPGCPGRRRRLPAHRRRLRRAPGRVPERGWRSCAATASGAGWSCPAALRCDLAADAAARLADGSSGAWARTAGRRARLLPGRLGAEPDRRHRRRAARPGPPARAGRPRRAGQRGGAWTCATTHPFAPYGAMPIIPVAQAERATSRPAPACAGDEAERSAAFVAAALRSAAGGAGARRGAGAPPRAAGGLAGGRLARRDLPRGPSPVRTDVRPLQDRRSLVPQLDGARSWRCAASRSATSRSATRASTSPTRGTTCDRHPPRARLRLGGQTIAYPRRPGPVPGALPRPARARTPSAARPAAPPASRSARPTPSPPRLARARASILGALPVLRRSARRPARRTRSSSPATTGWPCGRGTSCG